jgi:hypothetical protein
MMDLFAIQDELAARVAGAIEPELLRSEAMRQDGDRSARDLEGKARSSSTS